jgi:hypothetical protein
MISKAYRATRVNDVDWDRLARGNEGLARPRGELDSRPDHGVCRSGSGKANTQARLREIASVEWN